MKTVTQTKTSQQTAKTCPPEVQAIFDQKKVGEAVSRHGDLMLIKATLPVGAVKLDTKEVLRTGNVHGVRGAAVLYEGPSMHADFGTSRYIVVNGPAEMALHLEHKDGPLAVGTYEARRAREGRSDAWRRVQD